MLFRLFYCYVPVNLIAGRRFDARNFLVLHTKIVSHKNDILLGHENVRSAVCRTISDNVINLIRIFKYIHILKIHRPEMFLFRK